MTFKEAMMKMIDGKACSTSRYDNIGYKFFEGRIVNAKTGNWDSSSTGYWEIQTWRLLQKTIIIDGKTIELSEESYNELKRSLT